MEGEQTSANVSLKEMRWPSFSVSTSTPSQSKSSAAGRAAAGAPPAPATDTRAASARGDLPVEKRREQGASLLPPALLGRHCAAVHGPGRALEMVLAGSNVEEEAAAAMACFGRETMWIARLVVVDPRLGFDGKVRHTLSCTIPLLRRVPSHTGHTYLCSIVFLLVVFFCF